MISVHLNGQDAQLPLDSTIRDAVVSLTGRDVADDGRAADGGSLGLAVAVDGSVIPRSQWAQTPLSAGQIVEVVTAVQGG